MRRSKLTLCCVTFVLLMGISGCNAETTVTAETGEAQPSVPVPTPAAPSPAQGNRSPGTPGASSSMGIGAAASPGSGAPASSGASIPAPSGASVSTAAGANASASQPPAAKAPTKPTAKSVPVRKLRSLDSVCPGQRKVAAKPVLAPGMSLASYWLSSGRTTVVFVPDAGVKATCEAAPAAAGLVSKGVSVMLLDVCGIGQAACDAAVLTDFTKQLNAATAAAKKAGATRVVLLGVGTGGTMVSASAGLSADAVVAVSAAPSAGDLTLAASAGKANRPYLGAASTKNKASLAAMKQFVGAMPAKNKWLVQTSSAPGYGLLKANKTGFPALVADWIAGRYR